MAKEMAVIALALVFFVISADLDGVKAQGPFDCYDACSTACFNRDTRLMMRCERKCKIRCDPDAKANEHLN